MKEESWSIRKMREEQKLSQSRNTYRQSVGIENEKIVENIQVRRENVIQSLFQRFQFFLEE